MNDDIEHITKRTLDTGLIEVAYTTFEGKGRGGGTTTTFVIFPKEMADLIQEK